MFKIKLVFDDEKSLNDPNIKEWAKIVQNRLDKTILPEIKKNAVETGICNPVGKILIPKDKRF